MAIIEHKRDTGRVATVASSTLFQRSRSGVYKPHVVSRAITRSHGVASWDFIIKQVVWVFYNWVSAGLGFEGEFSAVMLE